MTGLSNHAGESDNNNSFRYSDTTNGRNTYLLGEDSDSESQWQGWDSDQQIFLKLRIKIAILSLKINVTKYFLPKGELNSHPWHQSHGT